LSHDYDDRRAVEVDGARRSFFSGRRPLKMVETSATTRELSPVPLAALRCGVCGDLTL